MKCDNKSNVHDARVIYDNNDAMVAVCIQCKELGVFRKDCDGRMNNREYTKFFKREILQPTTNLYYKVYPQLMSVL